jgi:hypothetical protein
VMGATREEAEAILADRSFERLFAMTLGPNGAARR